MKYLIYISLFLLIQSCVSHKDLPTYVEKEIVNISNDTIDTNTIETNIIDTLDTTNILETVSNNNIEIETNDNPKEEIKINQIKSKIDLIDNTNLNDVKNESVGFIVYSIPKEMSVGVSYTIKLRISKEKNKIKLIYGDRNIPINDVDVDSKVTIESIRVEPIMSANLLSEEGVFLITMLSTEKQNIEEKGYTEWEWRIKPLKGGNNFLKLIVKVRISDENGEFYKDITVFDKSVKVKSNVSFSIKNWIVTYWQWLISTVFIPLIIWLYKKRREDNKI